MTISTAGRKSLVARVTAAAALAPVARLIERRRRSAITLNLHSVPERYAEDFKDLLRFIAGRFQIGDPARIADTATGRGSRPVVFFTFDDALRNHAEIVAPALDDVGVRAIFCVPPGFLEAEPDTQRTWFREHVYPGETELHGDGDVSAMTWGQVAALAAAGHRICSHGFDHALLDGDAAPGVLQREVVESRRLLEERLPGVCVDGFCWPIRAAPVETAADSLVRATYDYALCGGTRAFAAHSQDPYRIPRVNLEVSWGRPVVELQLLRAAVRP